MGFAAAASRKVFRIVALGTGGFATETLIAHADCLFFMYSSDDDDEVPLAKRPKLTLGRKASVQEPKPSPPSDAAFPNDVEKIPVSRVIPSGDAPASSAARDHPIYATVDAVVDFAEQFTRLESENAQLRKTVKSSADQLVEANRLATKANNENILLKDELKKLKQQLKDEQDARREATAAIDKKEGVLRESITNLLSKVLLTRNSFLQHFLSGY
ncbi:hypothetical protein QYE76_007913 [Lolium multiflorum]|uniref:Uncharacterized protein n=1 Tax=Lolium multiflorum TaxID=4521 RepID=A0AAD8PJ36_LOLMU|nr:hypothetical protein QYE76_007913 [Lolium multiflorum]